MRSRYFFLAAGGVGFFWQWALRFWPFLVVVSRYHEHAVLALQAVSSRPAHGEGAFFSTFFLAGAASFLAASGAFCCCALTVPPIKARAKIAVARRVPNRSDPSTAVSSSLFSDG